MVLDHVGAVDPGSVDATISTDQLTKRFGDLTAVSELTLTVAPGEVVGFLGPNGAGKTTTIRMLMGFIQPSAGTANILGGSLRYNVGLRRRVGYLPGDFRVDPALTGAQLVAWFARLRRNVAKGRPEALAERLELDLHRPFRSLSKGNRQKLGLVQAFMSDPDVLLLDEPTTGLDPLVQREFHALLGEAAARGAAILFSSHVLPEVERVADRLAIIRQGRLVSSAPVRELLSKVRRRLELRFAAPVPTGLFNGVVGVSEVHLSGDTALIAVDGPLGPAMKAATQGPELLSLRPAGDDLEDLFLSLYRPGAES